MTPKKLSFDRVLLYLVTIVVCVLLVFELNNRFSKPKVAFVDISKLVEGYKLRKDLEAASSKDLYRIKNVTDSLKMVRKMAQGTEAAKIDTMLYQAGYAFNQYYQQSSEQTSKKVWERLNPLMEQYGKEKGMQLMIGANGAGTVLYGSKDNDVTEDVLNYVNRKYEKGS